MKFNFKMLLLLFCFILNYLNVLSALLRIFAINAAELIPERNKQANLISRSNKKIAIFKIENDCVCNKCLSVRIKDFLVYCYTICCFS